MRALKNNWLRAGITLLFLLGAFFVLKAIEKGDYKTTNVETIIFHYDSEDTSEGAFSDPSKWKEGPAPSNRPCGTGLNKPCQKTAASKEELDDMLEEKTNSEVLALVDSKRD
ncbi:hypothetical protein [Sphingobacterium tabacisoli]|uniref:Uncharacterized protein n=1 Tax=Sphingobacterium tabacisoli TaxID=2044855 RepID=A0ABW5KXC1_9SPHI|nr:hypothetical protein [Sphingobacterium tabacisoli]